MNTIKTIARCLLLVSSVYLLADVIIMNRTGLPVATRDLLLNIAYGLMALSGVVLLYYYYKTGQRRQFRQSAWFIAGALALYLLLVVLT